MIQTRIWRPILSILTLVCLACGPVKPIVPAAPIRGALPPGDPVAGDRLQRDGSLGRVGFACVDCHTVDAPRPGRRLTGATAEGIDWCVERYMRRSALPAQAVADLRALPPANPAPLAVTGADLYAQQCAQCHARGTEPAILGVAWPRDYLRGVIRGTNRPRHPDTLMPFFSPALLDEDALKRLVDYVVGASAEDATRAPEHTGLSRLWMMVGSR